MPEDKENIAVEEMMKNLKRGEENYRPITEEDTKANDQPDSRLEQGGELVTRADGSKAIKVKSHKRRSHQPKKEKQRKNQRNKIILISLGVVGLLLAGIAFTVMIGYYNGNRFKEKVTTTVANITGAETELEKLDVSLSTAKIQKIHLDWKEKNSVVDYLQLEKVVADFGVFSFFGGGWNGSEVQSSNGEIHLRLNENPAQMNTGGEALVDFEFTTYKCNDLDAVIGKDGDWKVNGSRAEFRVTEDGVKQVYLYGGSINAPFFEEYQIKSGVAEVKPTLVDLNLNLASKNGRGSILLVGDVGYKSSDSISLVTKFTDANLDDWIDAKAQRFIRGVMTNGEGVFKMNLGDFKSKEITTNVESNATDIISFEFLETLSLKLRNSFYGNKLAFTGDSSYRVSWLKDKVMVSNMKLIEPDRMQILGDFTINRSNELSGSFKIGVATEAMNPVDLRALKKVFKEDKGDYIWTNITLSGSVDTPKDDLDDQFQVVRGERIKKEGSNEEIFDQLNQELGE